MAKLTNRITCLFLIIVLLMCLSISPVSAASAVITEDSSQVIASSKPVSSVTGLFKDTVAHKYETYINRAVELGLFSGFEDGTFRPDNTVTRGQFVTVLWRMMKSPESNVEVPFTDIASLNDSFKKAIAWAYENNVVSGTTKTTFNPGGTISRQQALTILYRLDGQCGGIETMFSELYRKTISDYSNISAYAKDGVLWAVFNDIAVTEENRIIPGGGCSRALLSVVLVKYLDEYKDGIKVSGTPAVTNGKSGFSGISIEGHDISGLTITPKTAGGSIVSAVKETVNGVNVTLYPGSEKLEVSYSGDIDEGAYYIVLLLEGNGAIPKCSNMLGFDQHTATASDVKSGKVSMGVYPLLPARNTDLTLAIVSSQFGIGTKTVSLAYTFSQGL